MAEHTVHSPLPGVFYRSPTPGEPAFTDVGQQVSADQTIGLVEVMKQFAPVLAGAAGTISAFMVEDSATVGPGDPVASIDVA